jgi:glycolate oxidase iron-sulfur subunit
VNPAAHTPARAPLPCALPNTPLAAASPGLDACVHCGFCLPACPTYVNLHDENDSPRGRLLLMRRLVDCEIALDDPDVGTHFDRCLGCRACETACPSGVPYGQLLEATRATMQQVRPVPLVARVILSVFRTTPLLSAALIGARVLRATRLPVLLARVLPERLAFPFAMLASTSPVRVRFPAQKPKPQHAPASAPRKQVVLLDGCVMRGLFAHTNAATARVVEAAGHTVVRADRQHCCGALHAHAGDLAGARELARRNIVAFELQPDALIGVNSAGCGAMLKEYAHLLHDDDAWHARAHAVSKRVRDVSELLASGDALHIPALSSTEGQAVRIAYDPPCHLMHAQRITREPLAVLRGLPNVELVPLADSDQCCGSAGIYNLVEPDTSDAVLAPKLRCIAEARVDIVATGNPGCLMQIGAGLLRSGSHARAVHPVDLLDAALHGSAHD